jgi:hypothetical protein
MARHLVKTLKTVASERLLTASRFSAERIVCFISSVATSQYTASLVAAVCTVCCDTTITDQSTASKQGGGSRAAIQQALAEQQQQDEGLFANNNHNNNNNNTGNDIDDGNDEFSRPSKSNAAGDMR